MEQIKKPGYDYGTSAVTCSSPVSRVLENRGPHLFTPFFHGRTNAIADFPDFF